MRKLVRWFAIAAGFVIALLVIALAVVEVRANRRFDAPYPAIAASTDPAVVEHGRYLVYGPAACAYCHRPRSDWSRLAQGEQLPLTGDHLFPMPFGDVYSRNLTPDAGSGIGGRSDAELARVLRTGIRADGHAAVPLMELELADDDLTAVISFLRSQPGVAHDVPDHRLNLLGKALAAFAFGPRVVAPPPATAPKGPSAERGDYLANKVASCFACHTDRGDRGELVGPRFAGGQRMDVAADRSKVYVTPNLTPDPETSPIGQWTEDAFVARFQMGEQLAGTPMPWGAYSRMTDDDVRSIYRYLRTLPPTRHDTGPRVQPLSPPSLP